jgi:hypothetical protein
MMSEIPSSVICELEDRTAEIRRLRAALVETARLLTLDQLQQVSEKTARIFAEIGLLEPIYQQKRKAALQELADQAQELDMGYGKPR